MDGYKIFEGSLTETFQYSFKNFSNLYKKDEVKYFEAKSKDNKHKVFIK